MMIQAEVSLYPLGGDEFGGAIQAFIRGLKDTGLPVTAGPMSTRLAGDSATVLPALQRAFEDAAAGNAAVMVIKASNACPSTGSNIHD